MPKSQRVSGEVAIRTLEKLGFKKFVSAAVMLFWRNRHLKEKSDVVPLHNELAVGTLRGILKQARVSVEEFVDNL